MRGVAQFFGWYPGRSPASDSSDAPCCCCCCAAAAAATPLLLVAPPLLPPLLPAAAAAAAAAASAAAAAACSLCGCPAPPHAAPLLLPLLSIYMCVYSYISVSQVRGTRRRAPARRVSVRCALRRQRWLAVRDFNLIQCRCGRLPPCSRHGVCVCCCALCSSPCGWLCAGLASLSLYIYIYAYIYV